MFGWEFPPFNSGGLGTACLGLTRALSREGIDITFVLPKKLPHEASHVKIVYADLGGMRARIVNSSLSPYITCSRYGRAYRKDSIYGDDLFSEVSRYAQLGARIASEEQFDIIYAHDWLSFGAGIEAKRVSGKPLIAHIHATEFDRSGGTNVNQEVYDIERAGMEGADSVIAVSQRTKDLIVERYGIPPEKIQVVHNGIDAEDMPTESVSTSRLRSLKDDGYKIVLFMGRITLQKGPDYFVRTAKRVLQYEPNTLFILAGSGDMEHQMMELVAQEGIAGNVLFPGFLRDAERSEAYAIADLFVMPSVSEPFGIVPLESMRAGTPVLISKQSGVSEVVRHALKVDFWDTEDMADKIVSVLRNPALHETLREHGVREVLGITWSRAAEKIKDLIERIQRSFRPS